MIKNAMTDAEKKNKAAEKRAESFKKQFKKLMAKYPDVRVSCDRDAEIIAWVRTDDWQTVRTYLNH
jgi:hypothetical protein